MGDYRVRDAVHSFIHFDEIERKIIDSRPFQRLRNIKQLAFCYYVYPGAMHARFEHSLGVMELATRYFDHFRDSKPNERLFRKNFRGFMKREDARRLLRLTALLHDIGHLPYSHSGESILPDGKKHEDVSVAIIQKSEVAKIIKKYLSKEVLKQVALLLTKGEVPPELTILKQIIAGQFDADRMDYLIRDSHHCGVAYGNFDYQRLLETLRVIPDDKGGLQLAIERGGVHSLEALILARYFMFAQVYFHRTRRLYDKYLEEFLKSWKGVKVTKSSLSEVVNYDDDFVWENIKELALKKSDKWAQRIYNRDDHHKLLYETSDHASSDDFSKLLKAQDELQARYPQLEIIRDDTDEKTIHKFYTKKEGEKYEHDLKVIVDSKQKSLHEESKWLRDGPKKFRCIRLYGYGKEKDINSAKKFLEKKLKS
jgi:HD superfamily phosphohydrolase